MKTKGYGSRCQPLQGLRSVYDDSTGRYRGILEYDRRLGPDELEKYDLIMIGVEPEKG